MEFNFRRGLTKKYVAFRIELVKIILTRYNNRKRVNRETVRQFIATNKVHKNFPIRHVGK